MAVTFEIFPASIESMASILEFVERRCGELQLAGGLTSKLLLIIEELFTNASRHGGEQALATPVGLQLSRVADEVQLDFESGGAAFNPFAHLQPAQLEVPVSDRPVGRLGLILIAGLASGLDYRYERARNCIRIRLRLGSEPL